MRHPTHPQKRAQIPSNNGRRSLQIRSSLILPHSGLLNPGLMLDRRDRNHFSPSPMTRSFPPNKKHLHGGRILVEKDPKGRGGPLYQEVPEKKEGNKKECEKLKTFEFVGRLDYYTSIDNPEKKNGDILFETAEISTSGGNRKKRRKEGKRLDSPDFVAQYAYVDNGGLTDLDLKTEKSTMTKKQGDIFSDAHFNNKYINKGFSGGYRLGRSDADLKEDSKEEYYVLFKIKFKLKCGRDPVPGTFPIEEISYIFIPFDLKNRIRSMNNIDNLFDDPSFPNNLSKYKSLKVFSK